MKVIITYFCNLSDYQKSKCITDQALKLDSLLQEVCIIISYELVGGSGIKTSWKRSFVILVIGEIQFFNALEKDSLHREIYWTVKVL